MKQFQITIFISGLTTVLTSTYIASHVLGILNMLCHTSMLCNFVIQISLKNCRLKEILNCQDHFVFEMGWKKRRMTDQSCVAEVDIKPWLRIRMNHQEAFKNFNLQVPQQTNYIRTSRRHGPSKRDLKNPQVDFIK